MMEPDTIGDEPVNILMVDDQPAKLLSYEAMLSGLGENLIKASSAKEALELLLRHEITVVLMDVSMPDIDGFELASIIRGHPRYQKTAIIFVSAVHLTDLDRLKGYASGAVDYVSVPIVPELLRAKVSVFTELFRKTRELSRLNRELEERVLERTAELETVNVIQQSLAERLREADRRKDEFLALLAHELRNPLASVRNAAGIMRMKETTDPELVWCREVIERQADQLTRLVDDLLDVSRITQGKFNLHLDRLDLAEVISAAVESSRFLFEKQSHQLNVNLPPRRILVDGDATRLTQAIANLLTNAAKYQNENGRIDLNVEEEAGIATIVVKDYGIGIAPEMRAQLFELFAQGERALDRAQGGLGIGLWLVKHLAEMHGGSVAALSEGLGTGSEFVIRLPSIEEQSPPPAKSANSTHVAPTVERRCILVVDDNHDSADSLAMLLELNGHDVCVAYDGPEAIHVAQNESPTVIFLDIGLPGMDGYEVCRQLRQRGHTDARIIAMTGYGQERDRQLSKQAGFDSHTCKPVKINELLELLCDR